MNARKSKGQKILAMAVVAMFAFCAFSVCFADHESDATTNKEYDLYVTDGAKFTYTPTFNVKSGTVTLSLTENTSGLTLTGSAGDNVLTDARTLQGTLSNTDATPKETSVTINANWAPKDVTEWTQSAYQTINFTTYADIVMGDLTKTSAVSKQITAATNGIATITVTGPTGTTSATNVTFMKDGVAVSTDCPFSLTQSGMGVSLNSTRALTNDDVGLWTFSVTASYSDDNYGDSATKEYEFRVYESLTIQPSTPKTNVYIGQDTTPEITFSLVNKPNNETATYTFNNPGFVGGISGNGTEAGVYTISGIKTALTSAIFPTNNNTVEDHVSYTITATATIKYADNSTTTETANSVLNVYKALSFMEKPKVDGMVNYSASGNPLDILLSADFVGATKITYNWGDGKSTTVNTNPDAGSKYSARHVYANEGVYVITVTAYNSTGTTTSYSLYDAKNAFFNGIDGTETPGEGDDTPDNGTEQSFFEKHGFQFIIFGIIAVLCLVAFFFFGIQNPIVLIAAIITALLAVLCFVYNDIGGLIEQLKAVLKI